MLKNVVAFVTGGASGLGRGAVSHLANQDARVVLFDLPKSNGKVIAETYGDQVQFFPGDVTSEEDVTKALEFARDKFNYVNLNVNCAGVALAHKVYNFNRRVPHDFNAMKRLLEVNVAGTFNVVRLIAGVMFDNVPDENEQRGVIVNTSGIAAFEGQIGQSAFAATQGAINSMTLPLARDLSDRGIRVVTIAVGIFDTPLVTCVPDKVISFLERTIPFPKRLGRPADYGQLVHSIYQNNFLNGEVIRLDGAVRMMP